MRLRTINDTPLKPLDRVFRQSRTCSSIPVIGGVGMVGLGVFLITVQPALGYLVAGFSGLMLLPFGFSFISTYRSENWLFRYSPPRLLIKIRSYQNHRLSDDDPVVLEIDTSEVAWIRKLREKVITSGTENEPTCEARTYLELKLKHDNLAELESQIAAERKRSHKGSKWLHYPVQVSGACTIRVEWRGPSAWITPKVEMAIEMLRSTVEVRAEEMDLRDYTVAPADKAAQDEQILELVERGQHIAAMKVARARYGYSLKQAKEFVEGLQRLAPQELR